MDSKIIDNKNEKKNDSKTNKHLKNWDLIEGRS